MPPGDPDRSGAFSGRPRRRPGGVRVALAIPEDTERGIEHLARLQGDTEGMDTCGVRVRLPEDDDGFIDRFCSGGPCFAFGLRFDVTVLDVRSCCGLDRGVLLRGLIVLGESFPGKFLGRVPLIGKESRLPHTLT